MTKINPEDNYPITEEHFRPDDDNDACEYGYQLYVNESQKQSILQNQEIVERLKTNGVINGEWRSYTISTVDLGKTIEYLDNGLAIIKDENSTKLKSILKTEKE